MVRDLRSLQKFRGVGNFGEEFKVSNTLVCPRPLGFAIFFVCVFLCV